MWFSLLYVSEENKNKAKFMEGGQILSQGERNEFVLEGK